jgi:hypothetical protein
MASGDVAGIIHKALRGQLTDREIALIGLSDETKRAITRLIETSPALEEAILNVADLCYSDGLDAASLGYGEPSPAKTVLRIDNPAPGSPQLVPEPECTGMSPRGPELTDTADVLAAHRRAVEAGASTCQVCHDKHKPEQIVKVGETSLIPGHEYVIVTKTSLQKYPREWRMGYLGAYGKVGRSGTYYGLQFSARGPDRTHGGHYGGTQTIDVDQIISATEVERDDVKRHVGLPLRDGWHE